MTGDARKVVMLMRVRGRGRERSCHLFPLSILWIPYHLIISKAISSDDCICESLSAYTAGFEPTNEIEWSRASFGCFHDDTPYFRPAMFPR